MAIVIRKNQETVELKGSDRRIIVKAAIPRDGLSVYQIAVNNGFVGTEQDWLESLKTQWDSTSW